MGYNTTVVVMNDALSSIANDPDFGKKLAAACVGRFGHSHGPIDVSAGGHCNAATVIETHHSSEDVLVRVGHNRGEVVSEREEPR